MTNPQKAKGDRAELEVARLVADLTGYPVRRKLGAGRADDTGDLDGIPQTTVQVKNFKDTTRAIREAIDDLENQRVNAGTPFAVAFIRRPGGRWLAVSTIEHWCTLHREATKP